MSPEVLMSNPLLLAISSKRPESEEAIMKTADDLGLSEKQ